MSFEEAIEKCNFNKFFGNIISGYEKYVDVCREFLKPHLWDLERKKKRKEQCIIVFCVVNKLTTLESLCVGVKCGSKCTNIQSSAK